MRAKIRLAAVAGIGALALAGGVATSSAGVPPGSTRVEVQAVESDPDNGFVLVFGRVFALPQQCAKNRRVELQFDNGSGYETTDSGRSSSRAYFTLASPVTSSPDAARVVAPKSKIKVGGKKVTCLRSAEPLPV